MMWLTMGVVCAVVLAAAGPTFAQPFSDVPGPHWASAAIAQLAAKGLVEGYPDGTFKGDRAMTRYEMAAVVARMIAKIESLQIPAPASSAVPEVSREDIDLLLRLVSELRAELADKDIRVPPLEEDLKAIKTRMSNVRITGGFRFRYDSQRTASGTPLPGNGNPTTGGTDASAGPQVSLARELLKLVFDGFVSDNVHLIAALLTGGTANYQVFNSSCFGTSPNCPFTGGVGQYLFGSVDNLFFDWKNAFGAPLEMWLGRFGGTAIGFGSHPVQFGPFGLLMNSGGDSWEDSTADSAANVVDGWYGTLHLASVADLQIQALIARVTGDTGSSTYFSGEDAYGVDANASVFSGFRLGAYYVANNITNPSGFAGPAPNGTQWHLYGPGGGSVNPTTANCPVVAGAGIQCAASGSGGGGYLQWDVAQGVHVDGEYAQWTDAVHRTSDTGYQANITWDLGALTKLGHNWSLQTGYLNFGQNFYPPYGAAEADISMADVVYPGNVQGFTATTSLNPFGDSTSWTVYLTFFGGNHVSNGQSVTEYEAGIQYMLSPQAQITLLARELRISGVEQLLLYRAELNYTF